MPPIVEMLTPYAQKIIKTNSDDFYVEILSRLTSPAGITPTNMSEFFHRLTPKERFEIFEAQNHTAGQLFEATGITSWWSRRTFARRF